MKRLFITLLSVTMVIGLFAAPITREQARKNAIDFLKNTRGSSMLAPVKNKAKLGPRRSPAASADIELYYVFNRGNNQGYIIVSGNDQTLPIIGYTEEGEFDYNNLPDNMRHWLDTREQELLDLSAQVDNGPRYALPTHDKISPMVSTKWNQGSPYNDECPMYFSLGRSVTGCVATAMAQVLYFQRAKSVTEVQADIPGYTGWTAHATYGNLAVEGIEAGSPIDWDNMLDSYGSSATAKQKKAVAQLMHYCGVSVKMDYTNSSSGAQSSEVPGAFQKYFGYGSKTRIVYQNSYSEEGWDDLLYKELAQGRPFYLSGYNSDGGHAFVCDGYDGNYCYHINWGWGGASDGFYMLSKLNPGSQGIGGSSGGYSDGEAAVIGCEPENYNEKSMPIANATVKKICLENFDANGDGTFTYGEAAAVQDIGTLFQNQTGITAFEELYNFTSLKEIADDAFNGCTRLATLKLPKAMQKIGKRAFANCRALKNFKLTDGLTIIGDSAFANCRVLPNQVLPSGISRIEDNTFENCQVFTSIDIPLATEYIGKEAFKGCTKLKTMGVRCVNPQTIVMGADVFSGIDLSDATLNTLQGTRSYFASAEQWKEFGNLIEERNLSQGKFTTLETNKDYYIYNVGTGYFLTKGEAWGTQAIVANTDEPMRFQFKHSTSMADGVYYLSSQDTGATNKILFRTNTDGSVGNGVNACFVDGTLSAKAYWKVALVEGTDNIYTLQIPSNGTGYNASQFLGIQPSHESNASSPTYGAYSDVDYNVYAKNCQWMLVEYNEQDVERYQKSLELKNLLALAKTKRADSTQEQAVYDNFESSVEEMDKACRRLRKKMNFIEFVDAEARRILVSAADADQNGEISYTEAAAAEGIGQIFYNNTAVTDLSDLKYFTGINLMYGNSFFNCTKLKTAIVPENVTDMYYRAFMGCTNLQSVSFGSNITYIGDESFSGCTKLTEFRIAVADPANIEISNNVFTNVNLSKATLYVPYGSKEAYAKAEIWKEFGTIKEMRAVQTPKFCALEENKDVYVYNLGMKGSITQGEAYGTQAVVALKGFVYQLRRTSNMPEGLYYLYSENAGGSKTLFRTSTDSKVGQGVKACFADGSLSAKAYWKVVPVEGRENVYTFQVPSTDAEYVEGEYLGTEDYHTSDFTYSSKGLYYDINYGNNPEGCHWAFISVDEVKAAKAFYELSEQLRELLIVADAKNIEDAQEHAVYDDFESTEEQINNAIQSLRKKLHYIDFTDTRARTIAVNMWDNDEDDELSLEEAASVTSIGAAFRSATAMKSFDEFRYFTGVTKLDDEAFRGCSALISIYLPENLTSLGEKAFYNSSALKYMAVLGNNVISGAAEASLPKGLTVFVPKSQMEAYAADETWGPHTIKEYTGTPMVTAEDANRLYGRSNPKFTYDVTGAPINGEPELTTEALSTTPIGEYEIVVEPGTITTPGLQTASGKLTIERSPLTLTAKSFSRNISEENPEFVFTHSSLRNREKIDDVLTVKPTIECDATIDSPGGWYEIRIYGAEADNYEISYVNGTLTVVDPVGVRGIETDDKQGETYDLTGRKVKNPKKGIYIVDKRKQIIKK